MSCHGCASKYSLFNKELGCPQCGFSYCNKCLRYKAAIPKLGNTEHLVCKSCHTALTDILGRSSPREHPAASLQRLASLESPPRPPITVYKHDHRIQQLKAGLTQTDIEIAERLEKLREDRKRGPLPSEDEIAVRLALLKGENPVCIPPVANRPTIPRSEQQQAEDLLSQLQDEQQISLNQSTSSIEDITSRLAQLRGHDQSLPTGSEKINTVSPSVDGGNESMQLGKVDSLLTSEFSAELAKVANSCVKDAKSMLSKDKTKDKTDPAMALAMDVDDDGCEEEVIKKILAEAALEEKLELSDDSTEVDDTEELPWCVICNEDAKLKCTECSGDLYCESCFKQAHDEFDMKDHKTVAYKPTKNTK